MSKLLPSPEKGHGRNSHRSWTTSHLCKKEAKVEFISTHCKLLRRWVDYYKEARIHKCMLEIALWNNWWAVIKIRKIKHAFNVRHHSICFQLSGTSNTFGEKEQKPTALNWSDRSSSCKSDSSKRDASSTSELNITNPNTITQTQNRTPVCRHTLEHIVQTESSKQNKKRPVPAKLTSNTANIVLYSAPCIRKWKTKTHYQSILDLLHSFPQTSGLHQSHCPGHHCHCGGTSSNGRCRCGNGCGSHGCGHWGGGTGSHYSK